MAFGRKSDPDTNESIGEDIKEAQRVSGTVPDAARTGDNDDMVPDASGLGTVSRSQRAAEESVGKVSERGNKGTVQQASQEGDDPDVEENVGTVKQASQEGDVPDGGGNKGTVQQASQEGDKPDDEGEPWAYKN